MSGPRYADTVHACADFARRRRRATARPGPEDDPDSGSARPHDASTTAAPGPAEDSPGGARTPAPTPTLGAAPWHADPIGWTLAGGGVAVGAVGAFFLLDARSLDRDADAEPRDDVRDELRAEAHDRRIWGTVGAVAGGVLLVAGVVKLALTADAPAPQIAVRVAPTSIAIAGSF